MNAKEKVTYEFEWFNAHRDEIIAGHYGQKALIKDRKVLGYFDDYMPAIKYMDAQGVEMGNYIVHPCVNEDEDMITILTISYEN
jgi:hypothetical protein